MLNGIQWRIILRYERIALKLWELPQRQFVVHHNNRSTEREQSSTGQHQPLVICLFRKTKAASAKVFPCIPVLDAACKRTYFSKYDMKQLYNGTCCSQEIVSAKCLQSAGAFLCYQIKCRPHKNLQYCYKLSWVVNDKVLLALSSAADSVPHVLAPSLSVAVCACCFLLFLFCILIEMVIVSRLDCFLCIHLSSKDFVEFISSTQSK